MKTEIESEDLKELAHALAHIADRYSGIEDALLAISERLGQAADGLHEIAKALEKGRKV